MKIDIETIKQLAENVEKYNLEEVTLEVEGTKITLKKEAVAQMAVQAIPQMVAAPAAAPKAVKKAEAVKESADEDKYDAVTSPMVGTFYASPAPGAAAFVTEGTQVNVGDTLCIVEAMKLMNEVKANKAGKIVKVLKADGEGVVKGDKLFLID